MPDGDEPNHERPERDDRDDDDTTTSLLAVTVPGGGIRPVPPSYRHAVVDAAAKKHLKRERIGAPFALGPGLPNPCKNSYV